MLYNLLNALLSTVLFVAIYKIWLINDNNFLFIFLAITLTGVLVSWTLRLILRNFDANFTIQHSVKSLVVGLTYAFLVWFGLISWLFGEFPKILDLIIVLLLVKTFVFLLADFLADKISFGG